MAVIRVASEMKSLGAQHETRQHPMAGMTLEQMAREAQQIGKKF